MSALDEAAFTPYKEQIGVLTQSASGAQNVVRILLLLFANRVPVLFIYFYVSLHTYA